VQFTEETTWGMGFDEPGMMGFARCVAEADRVLARLAELGLERGVNGLEIYAMCEIPTT